MLIVARQMLKVAFAEGEHDERWTVVHTRVVDAIEQQVGEYVKAAHDALDRGAHHLVSDYASDALSIQPRCLEARLLRAEACLRTGKELQALVDYYAVIADPEASGERMVSARIGAAGVLERRFEFIRAQELLDDINSDERVDIVRERLIRRQRGEPFVRVTQACGVVMQDTLTRGESSTPCYHGYFAVGLRAVGRPWGGDVQDWNAQIRTAGFEFLQVLGGLRHALGEPVFALRIISDPDTEVAERGELRVALVVRVSAQNEASCRELALNLWTILHNILPMQQRNVYDFEPVVDEADLAFLLEPFEVATVAEIVRREQPSTAAGDRYMVYPFTSGTPDMHNLCWGMLRQNVPAMLSIQLQPTTLFSWERMALEQVITGAGVIDDNPLRNKGEHISLDDAGARWWVDSESVIAARVNKELVSTLGTQAFVLQISVATGCTDNGLLPETVASTLFGPTMARDGASYGGYEIVRASTAEDFASARLNLAVLDMARWVYSAAPPDTPRLRYMVGEYEAALAFRLPIPGRDGVPGLKVIEAKPVAPPPKLAARGTVIGQSIARIHGVPVRITQAVDDRRRHMYIVGKTGTGKSTLIKNMALQDIEAGRGVCVIDPHGDLIEDLLERIPEQRIRDTILFDPADEDHPIGLNLLQAESESEKQRIVNEFLGLLVRMYDPGDMGIVGPRFQHNVRNAMLTAMAVEGSTLIEVVRALTDIDFVRNSLLPYVKDPLVRNYWTKQIANTSDFHKSEVLDYIVSKFSRFVGDSRVRNIIGQRETTLDFRQVMDYQQILLVNLSKGKIGPESAQFLGLLMVQSLLITALSRADLPATQRPDFFLYVDEFQNFATDLFGIMLSEGRKYGIALTVANQYLTQLGPAVRDAVFGNMGSVIAFRLGTADAIALAPELYPVFNGDDLLNLPKFTACVKLLVDGTAARPFTMETLADTRPPAPQRAEAVRTYSRQLYGRDVAQVSEDVLRRFNML